MSGARSNSPARRKGSVAGTSSVTARRPRGGPRAGHGDRESILLEPMRSVVFTRNSVRLAKLAVLVLAALAARSWAAAIQQALAGTPSDQWAHALFDLLMRGQLMLAGPSFLVYSHGLSLLLVSLGMFAAEADGASAIVWSVPLWFLGHAWSAVWMLLRWTTLRRRLQEVVLEGEY